MTTPPKRKPPQRGKLGGRPDCHMVSVRLSAEERTQLEARASDAGLSVGAYLRQSALGTPGPRAMRRPPIERAALEELLVKTSRIGGNVYQLSRAANFNEPVLDQDVVALVKDLRALTNEMRAALGWKPLL